MIALILFVPGILASPFKAKNRLEAENAALRFFVLSSLIGIPVAALCWYVSRLHANVTPDPERHGSA